MGEIILVAFSVTLCLLSFDCSLNFEELWARKEGLWFEWGDTLCLSDCESWVSSWCRLLWETLSALLTDSLIDVPFSFLFASSILGDRGVVVFMKDLE